ncbi:uncharacterized protein [Diabrotica undecimpunctata]|uniref:uncharacterized protein n=1 Tax=Diabrotica undecimpunctata TaxID=50387 RepID=UPI003B633A40
MNLIKCICVASVIFCMGIISESTFIFPNPLDQMFTRPCIWVIIRRRPPFPTLAPNATLPAQPPSPSAPGTVAQTTIATNQAQANPATMTTTIAATAVPAADTTTTVVAETTAAPAASTMAMELSTAAETTTAAASTTIADSTTAAPEAAETTTVASK